MQSGKRCLVWRSGRAAIDRLPTAWAFFMAMPNPQLPPRTGELFAPRSCYRSRGTVVTGGGRRVRLTPSPRESDGWVASICLRPLPSTGQLD